MSFTKLKVVLGVFCCFFFFSCDEVVQPKPKAMLRLSYDQQTYEKKDVPCGFTTEINKKALFQKSFLKETCGYVIEYPKLKATIYLSYRNVNNDLRKLLKDAQKITQEHVIKADEIISKEYQNETKQVYGMFYEIIGDAASQSQFYVTDSVKHFLLGSLYFKVKPNFDSILPAASYLQRDMERLVEQLEWKNESEN